MSNKDKETERLEAEQSLYEHYWFDWYYGGRDRNAMIRWLKGNPQHVLEHHVDDLIQHLQRNTSIITATGEWVTKHRLRVDL